MRAIKLLKRFAAVILAVAGLMMFSGCGADGANGGNIVEAQIDGSGALTAINRASKPIQKPGGGKFTLAYVDIDPYNETFRMLYYVIESLKDDGWISYGELPFDPETDSDSLALMDWLQNMIWPAEEHLDDDIVYWGSMLAFAEMIRGGTTAFCDMYMFMDSCAQAAEKAGIRGNIARGLAGVTPNGMKALEENRKRRTRPARDIQGDAGRLKRYPFTCFPPLPEPLFFPGAAGGYEIRPQQNQRHTEPLPYIKSHIRLFGNLRILHKLQSKASAKEYKQAYSGY